MSADNNARWEKKYIRLDSDSATPFFIEAEIFGELALHRSLGRENAGLFTLTHVRTGRGLTTFDRICGKAAAELLASLDWTFDKVDGCPASTQKETQRILWRLQRLLPTLSPRPRRTSQLVAAFRKAEAASQESGTASTTSASRSRSNKKEK